MQPIEDGIDIDLEQLPIPAWGLACPRCQYALQGLPEHVCPECGLAFDIEEVVKPWHRLREPRITGKERPLPDFGLQCRACHEPLAGATGDACPSCGETFSLDELRPADQWCQVKKVANSIAGVQVLEMICIFNAIPHAVHHTPVAFAATPPVLKIDRDFYFEALFLLRRHQQRSASNVADEEPDDPSTTDLS